ncbi:MAG: heparinase II/III family protein [Eubacteriales bacterium]
MREKYLFIDTPLSELKKQIRNEKKDVFRRLYELARVYKEMDLSPEHPDKSTTYMGMAVFNLSLLYKLTDQKQYLEEAKRWIFTAVNYPHWGNKFLVDVDLSASFILFGLSIGYDWLKEDLTVEEEKALREKIVLQMKRMHDFKVATAGDGWATAYYQNHNWINMTGLATAGYALVDQYPELQAIIDDAEANFEKVYDLMPNDGSDYEGVVYWRYGVIWLYIYGHLAKTEAKKDHFKTCDFLRETFFYRLYQAAPNFEEIVNYGDCHDKKSGHSTAMYYKMAAEYNNGYAQHLGNIVTENFLYREQYESKVKPGILPETGLELLWYNPSIEAKPFEELDTTKYFEDLGLVVLRNSWDKDAFHYSFKCGMPGGKKQFFESFRMEKEEGIRVRGLSHQHADNTSFVIMSNDTYHAIDEGYNRTIKAREQNVITVDGRGYRNEGRNNIWHSLKEEHTAEITGFTQEEGLTYFVGSAPNMYVDELKLTQYDRHVLYTGSNHVYMIDELDSELEHRYTYHLHTEVPADEVSEGEFIYENGPGQMHVHMNSGQEVEYRKGHTYVKAIMTSQEPDIFRQVNMDTLYASNAKKAKQAEFLTVMKTDDYFDVEEFQVEKINEHATEGFQVATKEGKEMLLYSRTAINAAGLESDAKILFVEEKNGVKNIFAVGCTYINMNGQAILEGNTKEQVMVKGV